MGGGSETKAEPLVTLLVRVLLLVGIDHSLVVRRGLARSAINHILPATLLITDEGRTLDK